MREFIIGIVVDVLSHVFVKNCQGSRVRGITAAARDFASVWDTSQLVVLHPEVGFEDFGRGCESEQSGIARSKPSTFFFGSGGQY